MSFTRMTKEAGVISALSNKPNTSDGLTPAALKAKFDEMGAALELFINNTLLPELEDGGAGKIGITAITGLTAATVQAALAELKSMVDSATTGTLPNGSITAEKLAALAVTTAKLGELAVTTAKLADAAVTAAKLATDAVETAKIVDGAVTADKLAGAAVTSGKIGSAAVDTANLADGAVATGKLADGAVTAAKLDADATRLRFTAVAIAVSDWAADETYADYPFRASATLTGVTAAMRPEVVFAPPDADSGNFAPVADSHAGGVYLYAKRVPGETLTIPTVELVR